MDLLYASREEWTYCMQVGKNGPIACKWEILTMNFKVLFLLLAEEGGTGTDECLEII